MLTQEFKINLTKLIDMVNCSIDTVICRVIIINNTIAWKKSIIEAIYVDRTLYTNKYYDITCEVFNNDEYIKSELRGCLYVQLDNILNTIESLECMIITIRGTNDCYDRKKGTFQKPSYVYTIFKN